MSAMRTRAVVAAGALVATLAACGGPPPVTGVQLGEHQTKRIVQQWGEERPLAIYACLDYQDDPDAARAEIAALAAPDTTLRWAESAALDEWCASVDPTELARRDYWDAIREDVAPL
jgi:hypothetical protein